MEFSKGPLGSHRNYITHIVLPNFQDYFSLQERHKESGNLRNPEKYDEFRYFLNALESMNNILDYYYFENESTLNFKSLNEYKIHICSKFPIFSNVADISNAYKHCVREIRGSKNTNLPWAKDIQKPTLLIDIKIPSNEPILNKEQIKVKVDYDFQWPLEDHENIITNAFRFLIDYTNSNESILNGV